MNHLKFHIGFPVDDEHGFSKYYLLYHSPNKFHYLQKKEEEILSLLNDKFEPEGLSAVKQLIRKENFIFFRKGGEKHPPAGRSSMLAFLIAGLIESSKIAEINDTHSPVLLFSCSLEGKPNHLKDAVIGTVTDKDPEKAKKSLINKWDAVKELQNEGHKVVIFLHEEDADVLEESGEPIPPRVIMKTFADCNDQVEFFIKSIDLENKEPVLFSLKESDFVSLAKSLSIDFYNLRNLQELFQKIEQEKSEKGLKTETAEETVQALKKLSENEQKPFINEIAQFHIEAAKSYSHRGAFDNIEMHFGALNKILFGNNLTAELKNSKNKYLLESAVIKSNALADTIKKISLACSELDDAINDYEIKDLSYWKAVSAKGHILRLAKRYKEAEDALKDVVKNIDRHEILQPKIHLISVLARQKKIEEAVLQYEETELILNNDKNCEDRQNSLEFLRVAGAEIVINADSDKRESAYEKLDRLPFAFDFGKNEFPRAYQNQLFIHYKCLIEKSIGKSDENSEIIREFYLFLSENIAKSIAKNRVTLVTMIQLAVIMSYIFFFELKNSEEHKNIITNFASSFSAKSPYHHYSEIYELSKKMYELLRSGEAPNKSQLIEYIEKTMYMVCGI
ncbi:MAG: hypothetical protein ACOX2F_02825 [bacterium]